MTNRRDSTFVKTIGGQTPIWPYASLIALGIISGLAAALLFDHPTTLRHARDVFGNDLSIYAYAGESVRRFWEADHRFWGYTPSCMAGYPYVEYTSGLTLGMAFIILDWMPLGARMVMYMLVVAAVTPFAYYAATARLESSHRWRVVGALMGTLTFFMGPGIYYWWMGTVEATFSVLLVMVAYLIFLDWARRGYGKTIVALTITGAAAIMFHKTGALCLAMLILVSLPFLELSLKKFALLCISGIIMLALNSFWIIPLIRFWGNRVEVPKGLWSGPLGISPLADFFSLNTPAGSLPLIWFLLVTSILGFRSLLRNERRVARAYIAGLTIWTLIAYVGQYMECLDLIQPRRFLMFVVALLVPPSVLGFKWVWEKAGAKTASAILVVAFIAIIVAPNAYRRIAPFPLMTSVPQVLMAATDRIAVDVPPSARVLIEETTEKTGMGPYHGGHFPTYINLLIDRQLLISYGQGLKYGLMCLRAGEMMGRPIESFSDDEIRSYMDIYNVMGILCFTDAAKARFDRAAPLIEKAADFGKLRWYKVNREPSFIFGGTGQVKAWANHIEVRDLKTDATDVILKYHWAESLACDPPLEIERADLGVDPVGFIRVHNPPTSFTIYNKY